ncbi:MAG: nicotinamide-nucleotide amidohydrolase family protein [Spirochaetaceae bacterium]
MHKNIRAAVYSLGTEITEGIIQDAHGQFLSSELTSMGIRVDIICTLRDGPEAARMLKDAIDAFDLIIITGGLGPTVDDITREAVAEAAGVPIVFEEELWRSIESRYGLSRAKANRRQAQIPRGFNVIENAGGTAPGFWGKAGEALVCALPGPPRELQPMFFSTLKNEIAAFFDVQMQETKELSTFLIPEAVLEDVCAEFKRGAVEWRTRFQPFKISLYLEGGTDNDRRRLTADLKERFGKELVREGDCDAFALLSEAARRRKLAIIAVESCTGGLIGKQLTDIPGSSDIFWGSFVTYSDEAKQVMVGVKGKTLADHGAVSRETAEEMARGALEASGADVAVAVTGVAGPSGGSPEKPVGTVCFAAAGDSIGLCSWVMRLGSRRDLVRRRSAVAAALLLEAFLEDPESIDRVEKWNYS